MAALMRRVSFVVGFVVLVGGFGLLPGQPVRAAAFTVTDCIDNVGDPGSLRFAVNNLATGTAATANTITFAAGLNCTGANAIVLTRAQGGTLTLGQGVTIDGTGATIVVDGGCTLSGGVCTSGGVTVFTVNAGVTASIAGLTIQHGNTGTFGGGIWNNAGTLTVTNSTLAGNSAGTEGGGIHNSGTLTVTNSTLAGNSASSGGGIYNAGGTLNATNSTLSGNSATNGGGIATVGGTLNATNTLIAANSATISGPDLQGSIASGSHNLIGGSVLLGALGSYGGPTQTRPPLPGSPAIDAGSCPSGYHDQRGVATVGAACDIGAFESQGFLLGLAGGYNQATAVGTAFAQPLLVIVTSTHGEPVEGGHVTFTTPASGASATLAGSPATIGSGGAASVTATANGSAGAYSVTASAAGASSGSFALANTPVLTGISPSSGGTTGGNHVTLSGLGFGTSAANVTVSIGGVAAAVASVANAQLVVSAPAHAAGTVDVVVMVNGERVTAMGSYMYGAENALPNPQPPGGTPGSPNAQPSSRPSAVPSGNPNPLPGPRQ